MTLWNYLWQKFALQFLIYFGDLIVGVYPDSRDLIAFLVPLRALHLTSMPMGFTNLVTEFQNSIVFILQNKIPDKANIFIDDLGISKLDTIYPNKDSNPEILKETPGIRRFVWEHAVDMHRIMH